VRERDQYMYIPNIDTNIHTQLINIYILLILTQTYTNNGYMF
jgi:hypothetical protein